ncbi:hypothetical protein BDZ91DRAFT_749232 [Kalaharituber pfeilii]|nr:hypothetical protein BDZ91DRAFT_749232 [Kalaharituber pfeilii]
MCSSTDIPAFIIIARPTKKRRAILNAVAARKEKRRALLVEVDAGEPPAIELSIQEEIEARGHLVLFYPRFHCGLNFIEFF